MKRWIALLVLLSPIGVAQPAKSWERGPVCREPSVVDEMTRQIRLEDYYTRVNPALVTETGTAEANVVRCQVCVQAAPFEMTRFGDRPIRQCFARAFEVRIVPGGFVVRELR